MLAVANLYPVRELVVIGVAVVEETAMLDQQPAGVFRWRVTAIPAERRLAGCLADQLHRCCDLPAFLGLAEPGMVNPAIAVATDIPVASSDRRRRSRVGLEGPGTAKDRHRQAKARED